MKNTLLLVLSGVSTILVRCGGSDQTVARIAAPTATTEVAERETATRPTTAPAKVALPREQTLTTSFGSGVARTYQQKQERLRLLALAQNQERNNVRKGKNPAFLVACLAPAAKYPRTKNNLEAV